MENLSDITEPKEISELWDVYRRCVFSDYVLDGFLVLQIPDKMDFEIAHLTENIRN